MGVQLQRLRADDGLDGRNQRSCSIWGQQSARILDVERVDVRARRQLARRRRVMRIVVHRAQCEDQRRNHILAAALLHHARAGDVRVGVVHGVGKAETTDAVARQYPERERHELRVRGLPRNEAKPRRHELQRRIRRCRRHQPDALPRVLLLVADRHSHVRGGGEIDGLEAHPIHRRRDGESSRGVDTERRPEALVAVAQRGFNELNVSHCWRAPSRRRGVQAAAPRIRYRSRPPQTPGPRAPPRGTSDSCGRRRAG